MPLVKRAPQPGPAAVSATRPSIGENAMQQLPQALAPQAAPKQSAPKVSKAVDKESYWERKEVRDVRTGECIRLSGVLQALLSSVNYGQYCTIADKAAYLAEVKKDAKELAKFITEEA